MAYIYWGRCKDCGTKQEVRCDGDNPVICQECQSVDNIEEIEDFKIESTRFGSIEVLEEDALEVEILGFENLKYYTIMDPKDSTQIKWLQSLEEPQVAFPVIDLELLGKGQGYGILTIPSDISQMTVNLLMPIIFNGNSGKQESADGSLNHPIYHELKKLIKNLK